MNIASMVIWLNALVFFVYGLAFVLAPESLSLLVTGGSPASPSGVIDMRSTYGGMSVGLGVFFGFVARDSTLHHLGLRAVAVVMSCMAASRVLGIALDGGANSFMWAYLGAEIFVICLAFGAIRSSRVAA